ncbi:MAG TPA: TetR/AcrR family transcriptional regulator [Chitinophagales bacterium]|nr:TetR/AcrR family transcriptional regulator [Chitinophagales bacterium]HNM32190.1 TetR/AcrR family transcriptional regulator [Chitinophagales bacterium]
MSKVELKKQKKEELRKHILTAAQNIASDNGWQNVTIRKICDEIGYTAPIVYHYFESKEMILQELRREGFVQIFEDFETVNIKFKKPEKRLLEYGLTWWNFALKNSEIYQVMFNLQGAICLHNNSATTKVNNTVMSYYHPEFSQLNKKAKRSEAFRLELTDNMIAIIHGFISMQMANKVKSPPEKILTVFKNALLRFIDSITEIKQQS